MLKRSRSEYGLTRIFELTVEGAKKAEKITH